MDNGFLRVIMSVYTTLLYICGFSYVSIFCRLHVLVLITYTHIVRIMWWLARYWVVTCVRKEQSLMIYVLNGQCIRSCELMLTFQISQIIIFEWMGFPSYMWNTVRSTKIANPNCITRTRISIHYSVNGYMCNIYIDIYILRILCNWGIGYVL